MRAWIVVAVVVLAAPACGRVAPRVADPDGTPRATLAPDASAPAPVATPRTAASPGAGRDPSGGANRGPGPGGDTSEGEGGAPPPQPVGNDGGPVGSNALVYLRGDVPKLTIEIDAVSGMAPASGSVGHVRQTLAAVADKSGGVAVRGVATVKAKGDVYGLDDIRAMESANRDTSTTGAEASLYVQFLNGRFSDGSVLGIAYSASSFAIFSDTVRSSSSPLVAAEDIERAVFLHEVGHLLRLVNIGYRSRHDHEDPEHQGHSSNRESVMYWAVESDVISSIFNGPPPDTFDNADLADLADLKAGRV